MAPKTVGFIIIVLSVVLSVPATFSQAAQQLGAEDKVFLKDSGSVGAPSVKNKEYRSFAVVKRATPKYPPLATKARLQGKVTVGAIIDKTGRPRKTEIIKREPAFLDIFDEYARKAVMESRYSPVTGLLGQPVPFRIVVPINFQMPDYEPAICISQAIPDYPKEGYEQGVEGWVVTGVIIDRWGKPDEDSITVLDRCPRNVKFFDSKAKEIIKKSSFKAAAYRGEAEKGWVFLKVNFKIDTER